MTTEQAPGIPSERLREWVNRLRERRLNMLDQDADADAIISLARRIEERAYQHGVHDGSIDGGYHNIEWETCTMSACVEARAK